MNCSPTAPKWLKYFRRKRVGTRAVFSSGFLGSVVYKFRRDSDASAQAPLGQGNCGKCIPRAAWGRGFRPCSSGRSGSLPLFPRAGELLPRFATRGNFPGNLSNPAINLGERAASESNGLRAGAWAVVPLGGVLCVWCGGWDRSWPGWRGTRALALRTHPLGRAPNTLLCHFPQ